MAAKEWRSILGQVQQHAQIRRLADTEEGRLEQLDDPQGERRGGGQKPEAAAEGRHPGQWQREARADADRERSRRPTEPDGLSRDSRQRQAPFRRYEGDEDAAPGGVEAGWRRRPHPHLPAGRKEVTANGVRDYAT